MFLAIPDGPYAPNAKNADAKAARARSRALLCSAVFCGADFMKVSEILRQLQDDGWSLVATRGSHRQFKHPVKSGRVTVAGKPCDDLAAGTRNSILKQAGLKK